MFIIFMFKQTNTKYVCHKVGMFKLFMITLN